jgi:hypothetical protein
MILERPITPRTATIACRTLSWSSSCQSRCVARGPFFSYLSNPSKSFFEEFMMAVSYCQVSVYESCNEAEPEWKFLSSRSPMSRLMCLLLLPCMKYILNILMLRTSTRFLTRPGFSTNPSTTALPDPCPLRLSAFQTFSTLLQQPDTDHFEIVRARLLSRSSMLYLTPCFARQLFAGHNVFKAARTVAISSILHQMGF